MRWFVLLLRLCLILPVWSGASAVEQWRPPDMLERSVPGSPWTLPPARDWPPPPPSAMGTDSAELLALQEQVLGLWSALALRDVTVEELRRRLFAALQQRDHWWSQLRWIWEQARRDHALAWQRIAELETALAQAHHGGALMAEQLAGFRARVQANLQVLAARDSRIRIMEREQTELKAQLEQRTAELHAARDSLSEALAENTRLRADSDRAWSGPATGDGAVPHRPERLHPERRAVEIAAFEMEPAWARQGFEELQRSLHQEVDRLAERREGGPARATADDLHATRVERGYLEMRLKEVLAEREELKSTLSSAQLSQQQAMAEAETHGRELALLRERAAALQEKLQGAAQRLDLLVRERASDQGRISALETENTLLMQKLLAVEGERAATRAAAQPQVDIAGLTQAITALETEMSSARAYLMPLTDNDMDAENIEARAAKVGDAYTIAYAAAEPRLSPGTALAAGLDRLSDDLFMQQSSLARSVAATGVYTVLPRDSLSRIAYKVYGSSERWPDIYAANDHLLNNPDSLLPGLVLVIP